MSEYDKKPKKKHLLLKLLALIGILGGWLLYQRTPKKQRSEFKHSLKETSHQVSRKLVDFFIPHERNGYKPHVFHETSVKHLLLLIVVVKVSVLATLFTLYPNFAQLNQDIRSEMYRLINQYRVEKGEQILAVNSYLEATASRKGGDMLENNYFSHFGLDGKKPWQWLDTSVYDFKAMGENLAMDFLTADSVFRAFQNSPTHDRNLISDTYSEIGISIQDGYLDGHDTSVMVVFFANPKVAAAETVVATAQPIAAPVQPVETEEQPPLEVIDEPTEEPVSAPIEEPVEPEQPVSEPEEPTAVAVTDLPAERPVPDLDFEKIAALDQSAAVLGETLGDAEIFTANLTEGATFSQGSVVQRIMAWSDRFLMGLLIALVVLFVINIIVKIRVQHAPAIINATLLIIVATIALRFNVHQAEALGDTIRILGQIVSR